MQLYADLKALESCLDFFEQQERAVFNLMQLLREERQLLPQELMEKQKFYEDQLLFLQNEKRRIRLRYDFLRDTLDNIRSAKNALENSLDTAAGILSSDNGLP